jgi:dienelactone hydrolase
VATPTIPAGRSGADRPVVRAAIASSRYGPSVTHLRLRRLATPFVALVLLGGAAACGSDDDSGADPGGADAGDTTDIDTGADADADADRGADEAAYAGDGPHEVGSRTIALDDGRRVVVWYPAADTAADAPTATFDIVSLLAPGLQDQIPAELRPQYPIDASPGAEPSDDGPFPVVLFSHGFAGYPEQSVDLTTHLAGWGFVVVAPDHVERSLGGRFGTAAEGVEEREDPEVLSASLDAAVADADEDGSPLAGLLDTEAVAVAGHSAGASAAYLAASTDDRIDAFIAYSLGTGRGGDAEAAERPVPDVPGMVMLGETDETIPAATTVEAYEAMGAPKHLVEIADAGHLVFSDICLIGRDQGGLVGLIEAAGIELPENLVRLAGDGCGEESLDPVDAFEAVNHLSVAFLRTHLGVDDEPVGLAPAVTEAFDTAEVTLTVDAG